MFRVQSGGRFIRRKPRPDQDSAVEATAPEATPAPAVEPTPVAPPAPRPSRPITATPDADGIVHATPEEARELLRRGPVPAALHISGALNLAGAVWLRELPAWLRCTVLTVDDCATLSWMPRDLHVDSLRARRTPALRELEGRISVRETADFSNSGLRTVRADIRATRLTLRNCRALTEVEGQISVNHLDISDCVALKQLGAESHITQTLELANSGLTALPPGTRAGLRWRGVSVDERFVFQPDTLTGRDILMTPNAQRRRILLDRMGLDRFLDDVGGLVLDRDRDATGNERQLVQVPFDDDEPLVAVVVRCPSTGGRYVLRVPPHIRNCRDAVAWTAGMDTHEYNPIQEA